MAGIPFGDASLSRFETQLYHATREYLEQAEAKVAHPRLLGIEAAQALILVCRRDVMFNHNEKASLTMHRLARLLMSAGPDNRISSAFEQADTSSALSSTKPRYGSPSQIVRCVAFGLDMLISTRTNCQGAFESNKVSPHPDSTRVLLTLIKIVANLPLMGGIEESLFDSEMTEAEGEVDTNRHNPFTVLMLAIGLSARQHIHGVQTTASLGRSAIAMDYPFCVNHARIDRAVSNILNWLIAMQTKTGLQDKIAVLTHIIVLGVKISLYGTAENTCSEASFLGPARSECVRIYREATSEMVDLLMRVSTLDKSTVSLDLKSAVIERGELC